MHDRKENLAPKGEELSDGLSVPVPPCAVVTTVRTFVGQRMSTRNDLRHWRNFSPTQAAAANHEIAQAIQQAVINIVIND